MSLQKQTISLTFGDCGENHVGMEKIGNLVSKGNGFNYDDILNYKNIFNKLGCKCEIFNLKKLIEDDIDSCSLSNINNAYILIIKKGLNVLLKKNNKTIKEFENQLNSLEWDRKYFDTRRKKVLNKQARANLCFGEKSINPDYENKIGTVVSYDNIECLKNVKKNIEELLGEKCMNLICEGNRYFDLKKCGIGYHGDSERRKVLALRIGESMDLHYNWFYNSKSIGKTLELTLDNGDMYIMSEKAVGNDWKKRNIYTLRHAAGIKGCKYLKLKK